MKDMDWLKNKEELIQFLNDMKNTGELANLDNYIKWVQSNDKYEPAPISPSTICFKLGNSEFNKKRVSFLK